jgi:hypothetical protein
MDVKENLDLDPRHMENLIRILFRAVLAAAAGCLILAVVGGAINFVLGFFLSNVKDAFWQGVSLGAFYGAVFGFLGIILISVFSSKP